MITRTLLVACAATLCVAAPVRGQNASEDEYTRYELLAPESASFRITYDVTAVTPGAKYFFNPIRAGSTASDESVIDLMTGAPLEFTEVSGREARASGYAGADPALRYIRVELARPVPRDGEARIRILKTYKDEKSYHRDGDAIVFDRPLGIRRNAVVLPKGYAVRSSNIPVQVIEEADGRLSLSFLNPYPVEAPLVITAQPVRTAVPAPASSQPQAQRAEAAADAPPRERPMNQIRVTERAYQDREIVYFLKQPETHAFSLYHDYTAQREGEDKYVNVVRAGSAVADPSARILDTGEDLKTEILKGDAISAAHVEIGEPVTPQTEIVLIPFPAVRKGQSIRLRISETYTDAARYDLIDGQLMWHRSFGRPRNDMVLPAGWYLTTSSIPAVITQEPDGRTRLSFWNPRPDSVDVFVKARRKAS
jgi:hypothetical protein